MAQEVIEVVEREVEVIEILERGLVGPTGPTGPQANINYTVVSSSQTVSNRQMIAADTSGGSFTLTLPPNPAAGDAIDIFDYSDTFDTNPLTIARNNKNIEGMPDDLVANVEGAYFTLIFTGGARGWQVVPRYGQGGLQNVFTTQGDLIYRGASAETRLGIGTAGQVLKVNSGATAPEWGTISTAPSGAAGGDLTGTYPNPTLSASGASAGTYTKVTVDTKGRVTSGTSATASDVGLGNVSNTAQVTSVTGSAPIVSSGGTTPAISITEATTSASGSLSAADKIKLNATSGTNTGDQTITLTGNVTGSGTGSFAATIANDAVTNAKLSNMAQSTIKGRATASTGDPEDLSASQVRTILNVADGATANTASSTTPSALGTAAVGTGTAFAREDHVHSADISDSAFRVSDNGDSSKKVALECSGISASTTRTLTVPNASGTLALTNQISKTYAVFTAQDNQPTSANFATLDTRNSIAVLDFDDATDESAVFVGIMPEGASLGSGLKIRLHWMATTATSNNCVWDVSLERMTTDLDSDSFDTIASATAAANGTSGILTVTEITLTTIDSVTAGDGFRLKVTRDANNGSDNMSGDAELVAVEVRSAA